MTLQLSHSFLLELTEACKKSKISDPADDTKSNRIQIWKCGQFGQPDRTSVHLQTKLDFRRIYGLKLGL